MRRLGRLSLLAGVVGAAALSQIPTDLFGQADETPVGQVSPLVTVPETPEQRVKAALLLLKLTRPDLAKEQIDQVVAAGLDSTELISLRDRFGTGVFLRLARNKDVQPGGTQLLDQISAAARSQSSADGYLDELLAGLAVTREDSAASMREIKRLGPDAVVALTSRAGGDAASDFRLERVLSLLGDRAVAPLADVVSESLNDDERFLAIRVLERIAEVGQLPTLVAVAGNPNEGNEMRRTAMDGLKRLSATGFTFDPADTLKRSARELLSGQERLPKDNDELPLVYGRDAAAPALGQPLVRLEVSEQQARQILALRALETALKIDPDDRESMRMAYVLRLQDTNSADAQSELLRRGPAAASDVLDLAMRLNQSQAAVSALNAIALAGRRDTFAGVSPAARALNSPDPQVQFAAARAAIATEPEHGFQNSSRVVEILLSRLAGESTRKVVVVDPNSRRGGDIGGRLQQIGFTPILTESGREGFRTAASRSDVVLAVVHANSVDWELSPTVDNFVADARTASIPMAIVASTQARDSLAWIRKQHPGLMYVPVQSDTVGYREALKPAFAQLDATPLPTAPETRAEAASLLRKIVERRLTDVFPVGEAAPALSQAANDADAQLAIDATAALAHVGQPVVQKTLADLVLASATVEQRRTAAQGLVRHMSRYGSALGEADVVRLMDADLAGDAVLTRLVSAVIGLASR